ncbi:hypothetical protein [Collimonas pratensis]|uniref:Excinuclease ATPase subunit domain protein n=1 Tax=Collimonas pratensis TaxID=279113 RepID=A0ABM5ZDS7_9BURK|nr:hypothetical protein [Collimonas pratensis]AMP17355.1 excinuclease ATPase subunit domain protein [Collimonas pratensis]
MLTSLKKSYLAPAFVCLLASALAPTLAQARNTKLMLPVSEAVSQRAVQQALGSDLSIIFGSVVPDGTTLMSQEIFARGEARPNYQSKVTDDVVVCKMALQNALLDLIKQARNSGANAVVGIVSFYDHLVEMNSTTQYECHAGMTRGVVDLKAKLAKTDRVYSSYGGTTPRLMPPASGYADINDVQQVPFLDQRGREVYQLWLTRTGPRAFVVAEDGFLWQSWGTPPDPNLPRDPALRALQNCYNHGARNCQLYAVDNTVVYHPSAAAGQLQQSTAPAGRAQQGE